MLGGYFGQSASFDPLLLLAEKYPGQGFVGLPRKSKDVVDDGRDGRPLL